MLTSATKQQDFINGNKTRNWWLVDAENQTVGRIAAKIAAVLRGKHQPFFSPHVDCGDFVVVINADKVKFTGNKWKDKFYYRHSGYAGGLKKISAEQKLEKDPTDIIIQAVKRMMPRNALNRNSLLKLKVYASSDHPHKANKPKELIFNKVARHQQ